jgi:hypothetical protein
MSRATFVAAAACLSLLIPTLNAQEPKPAATDPYKILAQQEGEWDADITVTFPGPNGNATSKSKGVETNRLLGGKWLISDFKGELFNAPFEGHGENGYDAKKGKYVVAWVDINSKHIELMEGSYDEKTKTLTLNADTEDTSSGKPMKLRLETRFKDDGTRTFTEYYQMEGEKEFTKLIDISYTKRKK